jgi:hypothetical protein
MKFMILGPATKDTEAGVMPTEQELAEMGKYNEELVKAGVLLDANGLHPTSRGARVSFGADGKTTVKDGPFTEAKELIAGYSILQVKSLDEAIAWVRRAPIPAGATVEIRQIFSPEDFAPSDPTGELREAQAKRRAEVAKQRG